MLGQKGFIIQKRDFALLRIKNELFISRAGKHSASFHSSHKPSYCQTPQLESLGGMINNSLRKLELSTIGEAVISHEFRESLGCSKIDGTNTLNFVVVIFDRCGKSKKGSFFLNWELSIFWRNRTSFFSSLCIIRTCIILLLTAFMNKLILVPEF